MTNSIGRWFARLGSAIAIVGLSAALGLGAASGYTARVGTQSQAGAGVATATLTINGQPVAVLRTTSDGLTPDARVALVADRLQALIQAGAAPGEFSAVALTPDTWQITARKSAVLLVTPEEARAHHTTAKNLARTWTAILRTLLAEPALTSSSAGLIVPLGETRTFRVGGAALPTEITTQDEDSRVGAAHFDSVHRTVTVRGLAPGRDAVLLMAGTAVVKVPVSVMDYAARVMPAVTVSVTGDPSAPADITMQAVYAGIARAVDAQPSAQLRLLSVPPVTKPLASGSLLVRKVALRAAGPGLLPVQTVSSITVVNRPVLARPATALLYSNNPEQVKHGQTLFLGRLNPFKPVRLDYHHQNMSGGTLVFHADLINESAGPAAIQVISGVSLPGIDTVQVGRRAGVRFLRALNGNVGMVLEIPAHARVPMVTQRVAAGLTVSGIVQMQQINGAADAMSVQVAADSDRTALSPVARVIQAGLGDARSASPLPDLPTAYGNGVPLPALSPYVFNAPELQLNADYVVGGKWADIRIGYDQALRDSTGKLALWGNYGANYQITVNISNPTPLPRPVAIYFVPEAGAAAGVYKIDNGPVQEFDPISPGSEPILARYTLAPGQTQTVKLQTIPLNGSFYPVSFVVHAL